MTVVDSADAAATQRPGLLGQLRLTAQDVAVLVLVLFLLVAFVPALLVPSWTPRMAVLLCFTPLGVSALVGLAHRRDAASLFAGGFCIAALASSVLTSAPLVSTVGAVGRESSWLIALGAMSLWALARGVSERGARVLGEVLLAGAAFNAVVALLQSVVRPPSGPLALDAGRAAALLTHPVYLGAVMAGAGAYVAATWTERPNWLSGSLAGVFAAAVMTSGSRVALVCLILAAGYGLRRLGRRPRLEAGVAVLVGLVVGALAASDQVGAQDSSGSSAVDRFSSVGSALEYRFDLWRFGLQAVLERPLLGYGFGNFRLAVQSEFDADFTRTNAGAESAHWFDAHNIVLEVLVATGLVGIGLLAAFGVVAVRSARGPLAVAALTIMVTWAVQPAALATLPLALVLLGASMRLDGIELLRRGPEQVVLLIGLVIGSGLLLFDYRLSSAIDGGTSQEIESAASPFSWDPVVADLVAQAWEWDYIHQDAGSAEMIAWSKRTIEREADRPSWYDELARRQFLIGEDEAAIATFRTSVELQPWRPEAWAALQFLGAGSGDLELEREATERLCELGRGCGLLSDDE